MWTVASTTRSSGASNIIATNGSPVRCAEQIGVAAPRQPGERERLLADGRRRDGVHAARRSRLRPRGRSRCTRRGRLRRKHAGRVRLGRGRARRRWARTPRAPRESAAALAATSGPMPAGSPTVSAMRGCMAPACRNGRWRPGCPLMKKRAAHHLFTGGTCRCQSCNRRCRSPFGLLQVPSSPQPPRSSPLAFGSSYRRQHFSRPQRPDSLEGLSARSCCLAIRIETGSNVCSHDVQQSGRPQDP